MFKLFSASASYIPREPLILGPYHQQQKSIIQKLNYPNEFPVPQALRIVGSDLYHTHNG